MKTAASKNAKVSPASHEVDAYIRAASEKSRVKLLQVRRIVRATAPGAKERISYRMPYYDYHGALVWFAAFKNHIGLFFRPPIIQEHKLELKGYVTTKSSVHLPIDKPLPANMIRRLIKARIAKNNGSKNKTL